MDFEKLQKLLPYQFRSDHELANAVNKLSEFFTVKRDKLHIYGQDEKLVSAYTLFYALTNAKKLENLLALLPAEFVNDIYELPFVDFGSGPATFSAALAEMNPGARLILIEKSQLMQDVAKIRLKQTHSDFTIFDRFRNLDFEHTLFFGHSLNEIELDVALNMVTPTTQNIILIEPGTKESFNHVMSFREKVLSKGFHCLYPCLSDSPKCPVQGVDDWCHQILKVKHDFEVERISQIAKLDRKTMPVVMHVYSRKQYDRAGQGRIFQVLGKNKVHSRYIICNSNHELEGVEIKITKMKKKDLKELDRELFQGAMITSDL